MPPLKKQVAYWRQVRNIQDLIYYLIVCKIAVEKGLANLVIIKVVSQFRVGLRQDDKLIRKTIGTNRNCRFESHKSLTTSL